MSIDEINKLLDDVTISQKLRESLEKRKEILLNNKPIIK